MYACLDILRQRITRVCACNWSENTKKMAKKNCFFIVKFCFELQNFVFCRFQLKTKQSISKQNHAFFNEILKNFSFLMGKSMKKISINRSKVFDFYHDHKQL